MPHRPLCRGHEAEAREIVGITSTPRASSPRPGPSPLGRPARPASGPPRRSAEALGTATDRPTGGIGFNGHHPGVAAQIAGSNPAPTGRRNRPPGLGPMASEPATGRNRPSHPGRCPSSPKSGPFDPKNPVSVDTPKNAICRNQFRDLNCVNYVIYRNSRG